MSLKGQSTLSCSRVHKEHVLTRCLGRKKTQCDVKSVQEMKKIVNSK